jgi:glutathione S-transferase
MTWIAGRILFMVGYSKAPNKRGPGFAIQPGVAAVLWLGATG